MNFAVHDVVQRSPEWLQLRVGMLTGSCADAILAQRKKGTGELKVRADLRRRLVCERITGLSQEDKFRLSDHMERGEAMEPAAFAAYEIETGLGATRVGFVSHATMKAGCSPDGFVGEWEGILELKCPKSTTHLDYVLNPDAFRQEYFGQAVHALWLTGAQWCDLVSFDNRLPATLEMVRVRINAAGVDLPAYELAVSLFLSEVEAEVEKLMALATSESAVA